MSGGRRRILLALESSGPGGAERMVLSLAQELGERGHTVTILVDHPGWLTSRAAEAGVSVWIERQEHGVDLPWIWRLSRRLRREGIQLVHAHEFNMNVFSTLAARLAGIPTLATVHGHAYVTEKTSRTTAYRWLLRSGTPISVVSGELRGFLARALRVDPSRLCLVRNGIRVPSYDQARRLECRRVIRASLGLPPDVPLLVCVGNLYSVKGHSTVVQALASIPGAHVAIAGRGAEEGRLRQIAKNDGSEDRLHLLGVRDDVDALLLAADVFVHPSLSEGLPMAILEAMMASCAIVASRVGGVPEAIQHDETGLLTPASSPEDLSAAVRRLLSSPADRARLGAAARAAATTRFSIGAMVDAYLSIYNRLAREVT